MPHAWIVGVGRAATARRRDDVNTTELAWEAVRAALADAGVELRDVTGAVTASQDFWEGRTISSMSVNEVVGGTLGSETKVAADGTFATLYAMTRIEDSDQRLNLVVAHAKESQGDAHQIELAAFDPYYQRALGPDDTIASALQADRWYRDSSLGPEHMARVVAAARARSPVLDPVAVDEVAASPPTATPLRELDRAPLMDDAVALVVTDAGTARELGRPAVRLAGGAAVTGAYWTDRADLSRAPEARAAALGALERAGWSARDLDAVEVNAPFAHQTTIVAEELGLGSGEPLVARFEGQGGGPALNPCGGWLGGGACSVAGLASIGELARRLRERGGRSLAHGTTGICAQSHAVVLLEGGRP